MVLCKYVTSNRQKGPVVIAYAAYTTPEIFNEKPQVAAEKRSARIATNNYSNLNSDNLK
jgi:hypothetical protein